MLRRIFGPEKEKVAGGWIRLHNEERRIIYASPNIIRIITLRWVRWVGYVARMGEIFWSESLEEETTRNTYD
jgi:hypothetical protein